MLSARDLERLLIKDFDEERSVPLARALTELLEREGIDRFQAAEEGERMVRSVREVLSRRPLSELPFDFGSSDPMLLVGKRRPRSGESIQTRFARKARAQVEQLHQSVCRCSDFDFEVVCAAVLAESGASPVVATCSGDDGGIDLYGRLPLRPSDLTVPPGLLQTTLLPKEILVLGQCKRFDPDSRIGRSELQKFLGAVRDCLNQYDGNARPPSRRVPREFYRRGELCIPVFLTTAEYAETSAGEADANDLVLVAGRAMAEFLVGHRVGISQNAAGEPIFEQPAFDAWLAEARRRHQRHP
jgi:hypothetical protein